MQERGTGRLHWFADFTGTLRGCHNIVAFVSSGLVGVSPPLALFLRLLHWSAVSPPSCIGSRYPRRLALVRVCSRARVGRPCDYILTPPDNLFFRQKRGLSLQRVALVCGNSRRLALVCAFLRAHVTKACDYILTPPDRFGASPCYPLGSRFPFRERRSLVSDQRKPNFLPEKIKVAASEVSRASNEKLLSFSEGRRIGSL